MLIESVLYDNDIQPNCLKNLTLEKAYAHSCYFINKNGLIITVLQSPNRLVPYGLVCGESEFEILREQKRVSLVITGGRAVSLTLPDKVNIPADSASMVLERWERCYDDFKVFLDSAIMNGEFDKLLGLGSGLTPAGDDFLVGYIASREILGKKIPFEIDCSRTTKLSAHILLNALGGKFSSAVIDFLKSGDPALLSFGKSSGVATALGILKGMGLAGGVRSQNKKKVNTKEPREAKKQC